MPELPDVIPGEFIESDNQNLVQRRTIQRYTDQADLDTKNPTPQPGDIAYILDIGGFQIWTGATWANKFLFNGIQRLNVTDTVWSGQRVVIGEPLVRCRDAGSAAAPTYSFNGETGTGLSNIGGTIQLSASGVSVLRASSSGFVAPSVDSSTTGSAANVFVNTGGQMQRSTSARKYKSDIQDASALAGLVLAPVTFHHDGDDADYIGFIADDMPIEEAIIRGDDGEVENYDVRAVVAILAAQVNALTARLDALES